MSRILLIARREWLEQRRQPAMLGVIAFLDAVIAGLALSAMVVLMLLDRDPVAAQQFQDALPGFGAEPGQLIGELVSTVIPLTNWLIFTQFLGMSAVLAGHSVLHDRQENTLPFLLLAPLRRFELLAGKVVGSIGMPFVFYVIFSGGACALIAAMPVAAPHAATLPPSPAWMVAFFLGGPAWAGAIGAVCAIVSTMSRDVRTAQQAVWLVVLFAQFSCGLMLTALLPSGVLVQIGVALAGLGTAALTLWLGSQVISRDLSR
ncbi:MAG: ABC transporter permease subunit [Proteobacteria bacterium]|nr:ABC transporter permease subunit [Pseudomonadota bacterium]